MVNKKVVVPKLKRTRARAFNPTLNFLQMEVSERFSKDSPEDLRKRYNPYIIDKHSKENKKVFKENVDLMVKDLTAVNLTVTDTPYTCKGPEYSYIDTFKLCQQVQFPDSMAVFSFRRINSAEEKMEAFILDIPSFLHIFNQPLEYLIPRMEEKGIELAREWTELNGPAEMKSKRNIDEKTIMLDFRQNSKSVGVSEIVMAATTWNYTIANQHSPKDLTCNPEDIRYQLRYQIPKEQSPDGEAKPKAGMLIFTLDEWKDLFSNEKFKKIYDDVWNRYPLPQSYSDRIETYNYINSPEESLE